MKVVVRIHAKSETRLQPGRTPNQGLARAAAPGLMKLALVCFLTCTWRWTYDLAWVGFFLADSGPLSHWQVWFLSGALFQVGALWLTRYANRDPRSPSDSIAHA